MRLSAKKIVVLLFAFIWILTKPVNTFAQTFSCGWVNDRCTLLRKDDECDSEFATLCLDALTESDCNSLVNKPCVDEGTNKPTNTAEEVQCKNRPGTVDTAIGCIDFNDINKTAAFFLRWALGVAGGVALFLIALAGFRIATSQGNPQRLQGGQELLLSAIGGLLMIVLSVYLLRFIGVDLLGIF